MASLISAFLSTMIIFNMKTLVTAFNYNSSCIVMTTTGHSLDGLRHHGTPVEGTTNYKDAMPFLAALLHLMTTILPIVLFCHNTCLHHLRLLIPSEEPNSSTSIRSTTSCSSCNNIHDAPCTSCCCVYLLLASMTTLAFTHTSPMDDNIPVKMTFILYLCSSRKT